MVLAVNGYNESREKVAKFVKNKQLSQKMLLQGGGVGRRLYGVQGFPTSFFVDASGRVSDRSVGFAPFLAKKEEAKIEKALAAHEKALAAQALEPVDRSLDPKPTRTK